MSADLLRLVDEAAIRRLLYTYCRGVDRRDLALVRSCYTSAALDERGVYQGNVDGLMGYLSTRLPQFERTMHLLANVTADIGREVAHAETYAIAVHRLPEKETRPEHDYIVGFRYVDDLVRGDRGWLIEHRRCVFEWAQTREVQARLGYTGRTRRSPRLRRRSDLIDGSERVPNLDSDLKLVIAEAEIRRVLYTYCRGVDRRDYTLVRSCYEDGAIDDHGKYRGSVDGFIMFLRTELERFTRTMHFVGNVIVDVTGDTAWSEAYTIAFHRLTPDATNQESDYISGLRYLDRHTRREGKWRIAERRCIYEWSRVEPFDTESSFPEGFAMGQPFPNDVVYTMSAETIDS
jgi:hypothetical protein